MGCYIYRVDEIMNEILSFIRNEEDFRKFICLYKNSKFIEEHFNIKNNENIVYSKNFFIYNSCIYNFNIYNIESFITYLKHMNMIEEKGEGYNCYMEIKINKKEAYSYIKQYEEKLFDKYNFNDEVMLYSRSSRTMRKTSETERFFVEEYRKVYITNDVKEILNNFEKKYGDVYKVIKFFSQQLVEKEWVNIGMGSISKMLNISEGDVKKILDYLIEIGLVIKRKVINGKSFYYEYKAIDFIENKNIEYSKKIEVINKGNYNINDTLKNNPNMFYIIYEITDLTNGMKYIGKHKTDNLDDGYMGSGRLLKQNQEIKGIENFTKKILHLCKNEQHMNEMERLEIEKVKAYENNMYYNLI